MPIQAIVPAAVTPPATIVVFRPFYLQQWPLLTFLLY